MQIEKLNLQEGNSTISADLWQNLRHDKLMKSQASTPSFSKPCVQMLLDKRDEAFWLRQVKQPSIARPAKSNAFREVMERTHLTSSKLYHHSVLQSAQGQPFRLTKTRDKSKPVVKWLLVSHCACRTCTRKIPVESSDKNI